MRTTLCVLVCLALLSHAAYGWCGAGRSWHRTSCGFLGWSTCTTCRNCPVRHTKFNVYGYKQFYFYCLLLFTSQSGRFQGSNSHRTNPCPTCFAGQYNPSARQSSCRSCPSGQFQGTRGQTVRFHYFLRCVVQYTEWICNSFPPFRGVGIVPLGRVPMEELQAAPIALQVSFRSMPFVFFWYLQSYYCFVNSRKIWLGRKRLSNMPGGASQPKHASFFLSNVHNWTLRKY